jgi:hypothetical protein
VIRPAREDNLPILQDVERAAGNLFLELDMTAVAEDAPPPSELLRQYRDAGRAWVSDVDGVPVG